MGCFRIKELKGVLAQLGLSKQGNKQALVDRILSLLSDEQVSTTNGSAKKNFIGKNGVAKIIDDSYSCWAIVFFIISWSLLCNIHCRAPGKYRIWS